MSAKDSETRDQWTEWRRLHGLNPSGGPPDAGNLSQLLPEHSPRFVVLPPDPESVIVEFDDELWSWWGVESPDPATGGSTRWGSDERPTRDAALVGTHYGDGQWTSYVALYRSGAVEAGLGRASYAGNGRRYFLLSILVGRIWAALERASDVTQRFGMAGPHEASLLLPATKDAWLTGFGEGWAEPDDFRYPGRGCDYESLLLRREVPDISSTDIRRELAFSIGGQIEDAWGFKQRRFLAERGEFEGRLDPRAARW